MILLLAATIPAAAQQGDPERWHLNGSVGLSLNRTSQASLLPIAGATQSSRYDSAAGDLGLSLSGFWKDPELLPFTVDFNGEGGSNRVSAGGYREQLLGFGVNTTFLPSRPFPLHFFYRRSQLGARGDTFGQDADTTTLGVDWTLKARKVPRITTGYTRFTNNVKLPTSLFDNSYNQGHAFLTAADNWKRWDWGVSAERFTNVSNFFTGLSAPGDFREDLRVVGTRVRRPFWDDRADLSVDTRNQWRHDEIPGGDTSRSQDTYLAASFRLKHTEKLSSNYFYDYTRVNQSGLSANTTLPGLPGNVILLMPPSFSSNFAGGRLEYRANKEIRFFEAVRYQHVTPVSPSVETREALSESLSGVSYQKNWHGLDLISSYTGHLQFMGTNLGNRSHTFSNDLQGQAGWGSTRQARLVASASYAKLNLVDQLNGFTQEQRFRVDAETRAVRNLMIRFTADHSRIELLNQAGDAAQTGTSFGVQAEHRRFGASFTHTLGDGAGAVFPETLRMNFVISVPLPLDQLVRSPLLNRTSRGNSAALVLRLRRNLDFYASWRTQRDVLAASAFRFRTFEARARYRVGKVTIDFGFGSFRNESMIGATPNGLRTNRYLLRIARDFRLF